MSASTKLHQLESKISELQKQHQLLLKERQQEIASLLTMVDLTHVDDKTLIGGLLFLKEKIITQDPITEAWRDAGEKFLRYHKPKFQPPHQQREVAKQRGNYLQVANQEETYSQSPGKKETSPRATTVLTPKNWTTFSEKLERVGSTQERKRKCRKELVRH